MSSYDDIAAQQIAKLLSGDKPPTQGHVPNRGPAFRAIACTMFSLAAVFVALRTYGRIHIKRQRKLETGIGADGCLAIVALILAGGLTATLLLTFRYGLGKHVQDLTSLQLIQVLKLIYAATILIILCLTALRASILCLYLRITPVRSHRIVIWTMLTVATMHSIGAVLVSTFQCRPIHLYWDPANFLKSVRPQCVNLSNMNSVNGAFSLAFDVIIWLMPLPVIYRLQAPTPKKVGIYVVMMISGFSIVCAALRLKALLDFLASNDITWTLPVAPFVSLIEDCVALITSSIPVVYSLFVKPRGTSKYSKGSAGVKLSDSQQKTRWSSHGMPSSKPHAGWKFGFGKSESNATEMDVMGKGSMNTFHEIPSTTELHESKGSSG